MSFVLRCRAPFAAFRWMQAGVWRATSPVIPPSAAWGLVLNLAHIETRTATRDTTTLVRADAPAFEVAIASLRPPGRASLYQQLHSYPVGNSGKELEKGTHGSKYWIAPARREFLVDVDFLVAVRSADSGLRDRVRDGLGGRLATPRYGLPFAGDNNFLFDDIALVERGPEAHWYERLDEESPNRAGTCRLTIGIDRADAAATTSGLFAPSAIASAAPGDPAWVWVPRRA